LIIPSIRGAVSKVSRVPAIILMVIAVPNTNRNHWNF